MQDVRQVGLELELMAQQVICMLDSKNLYLLGRWLRETAPVAACVLLPFAPYPIPTCGTK